MNYADALAAVSFVGVSGFSIAMADPDVRCSITQGAFVPVLVSNLCVPFVISLLLVVLRRWEADLRSGTPPSEKAARYARRLHSARLLVVWLSALAAVLTLVAAGRDPACLV